MGRFERSRGCNLKQFGAEIIGEFYKLISGWHFIPKRGAYHRPTRPWGVRLLAYVGRTMPHIAPRMVFPKLSRFPRKSRNPAVTFKQNDDSYCDFPWNPHSLTETRDQAVEANESLPTNPIQHSATHGRCSAKPSVTWAVTPQSSRSKQEGQIGNRAMGTRRHS